MALNSLVKPYIYVKDVKVVDDNFHARFNVVKKEYVYKINVGEYNPLWEDYTWQINRKIDIDLMKKCAKIFIGVHNFQNFVGGWRNNYEAIIYDISFQEKNEILEIKLVGKSFYRYMVRNIVGAIMDVEAHKVKIEDVREALVNPQINKRFKTAVPNGLYLNKIIYEGC